jgi:hypothetical protein
MAFEGSGLANCSSQSDNVAMRKKKRIPLNPASKANFHAGDDKLLAERHGLGE